MTVIHFLKSHWLLVLALLLLMLMSGPVLYFNRFLNSLDSRAFNGAHCDGVQPVQIGVCLDNLVESRWFAEKQLWEELAAAEKIRLEVRVAHYSLDRQIRQIREFIHRKARVIMVVPVVQSGLGEVLKEAAQKGVKIILYDELADGPGDFYCGIDYEAAGYAQASSLFERAGSGTYLQICGPVSSFKGESLAKGQLKGLKSRSSDAARLVRVALTDWSPDQAVTKSRSYMMYQELTGILAPNDVIAEAIRRFYHEQNRSLPFLAGLGGEAGLLRRLQAGEPIVTCQFDYQTLARTAFAVARQFCEGKQPDLGLTIRNQGWKLSAYLLQGRMLLPSLP